MSKKDNSDNNKDKNKDKIIQAGNNDKQTPIRSYTAQQVIDKICSKIYWSPLLKYTPEGLFVRDFFWKKLQEKFGYKIYRISIISVVWSFNKLAEENFT
jgi:hypothetical protein